MVSYARMRLKTSINLAVWIGLRYLRTRRVGRSRLINWVSFVGLLLGIALLIVVLSVQNGLHRQAEQLVVGAAPHAVLQSEFATTANIEKLERTEGVLSVEPFVELYALLSTRGINQGVVVYGVDSLQQHLKLPISSSVGQTGVDSDKESLDALIHGSWMLSSMTPPTFSLTFPVVKAGGVVAKSGNFRLVGYSDSFVPGEQLQLVTVRVSDLLQLGVLGPNQVAQRITLSDPWQADSILAGIDGVRTWSQDYAELFDAINMEKSILFVMLTFVIGLASLNIVSGQAMLINSKKSDIAILRTMGAEPRVIELAFAMHGFLIALAGILVGLAVGILISSEIMHFLQLLMDWGVIGAFQLIDMRPFLQPWDIFLTLVVAFAIVCIGVMRPLSLVLRTNPIDALHNPT